MVKKTGRYQAAFAAGMLVMLAVSGCSVQNQEAALEPAVSYESREAARVAAPLSGSSSVTKEEAERIALNHAGVRRDDVLSIKTRTDYDDGIKVFEVEFFTPGKEYDYDIAADTGEIRSYDYEIEYADWKDGAVVEVSPAEHGGITKEAAEDVALDHAGVKRADVKVIKTELDYDDRQLVYEIDFYADGKEYDYDILAATGEIKSFGCDIDENAESLPSESSGITLEEARELVADRIPGVDISSIRIEKEFDDGRLTYEGKVLHGQIEYEFEIDAKTGRFLEWEVEAD